MSFNSCNGVSLEIGACQKQHKRSQNVVEEIRQDEQATRDQ